MRLTLVLAAVLCLPLIGFAADAKAGKTVYDAKCKNCHGATGAANPAIEKMMKVEIKNLSSSDVQGMSDAELKKVITAGKGKMPAMKTVTGSSLDEVVAYVRTLKK